MAVLATISDYLTHRRRLKRALRAVRHYSASKFPQDEPVWSMVAENRPDECVIYMTYNRPETSPSTAPHRFFKVDMRELKVAPLQPDYYPQQWGPFR